MYSLQDCFLYIHPPFSVYRLPGLVSFIEYPLHRPAYFLISSMNAAYPAARSPHTVDQFRDHSSHMFFSSGFLFNRNGPADPFVSCQWGNIFPCRKCFRRSRKCFLQIIRKLMYSSRRYFHTERGVIDSQFNQTIAWSLYNST